VSDLQAYITVRDDMRVRREEIKHRREMLSHARLQEEELVKEREEAEDEVVDERQAVPVWIGNLLALTLNGQSSLRLPSNDV